MWEYLYTAHWQTAYTGINTNSVCHFIFKNSWATQQPTIHMCACSAMLSVFCTQLLESFWSFRYIKTVFHNTVHICFVMLQSLFERQGMTLHGGLHPGIERGHIPLPKGMSRTKSFGKIITHPVHIQIRWMIVYLIYNMLVSNILTCY